MTPNRTTMIALVALFAASPTGAQGMPELPEICRPAAMHHMEMAPMETEPAADQAHADLAAGMAEMDRAMMDGMKAEDIDVAFICGMIPHHQGAITMAKAELVHGDDPEARAIAQTIIEAQEREIAAMIAWLEKQPK